MNHGINEDVIAFGKFCGTACVCCASYSYLHFNENLFTACMLLVANIDYFVSTRFVAAFVTGKTLKVFKTFVVYYE